MLAKTQADCQTASKRMAAGLAKFNISAPDPDALFAGISKARNPDIIVIDDPDGVLCAHWEPGATVLSPGAWWVSHVFSASSALWRTMEKEFANELIARGQGSVPIRFTKEGIVASAVSAIVSLSATATFFQTTAAQAVLVL